MNILFTICGRAGSKGLKNKNLSLLNSVPLPIYAISLIELYREKYKDYHIEIILSSDSEELHHLLEKINIRNLHRIYRNENLSGDEVSKVAVIKDAYFKAMERTSINYDLIIDLDITSPIRRLVDLENVISDHKKSLKDIQFTVTESRRNPYFNMVKVDINNSYSKVIPTNYFTRQECPIVYDMNASIYSYLPSALDELDSNPRLPSFSITKMKDSIILDIDSQNDLEILNYLFPYFIVNDKELTRIYQHAQSIYEYSLQNRLKL